MPTTIEKPQTMEAIMFDGPESFARIKQWFEHYNYPAADAIECKGNIMLVPTAYGIAVVNPYDMIIRRENGPNYTSDFLFKNVSHTDVIWAKK